MAKEDDTWIEASDAVPMFPTLVWMLQVRPEMRRAIDAGILAVLADLRKGLPRLGRGEPWQSSHALHEREELRDLMSCIDGAALRVLRFLRISYDAIEITGCWVNVLASGAAHKAHSHPNNFLSGVYYVKTHAGADAINFHDPRTQAGVIRPPVVELTAENTDQVVISVKDGTLLLFPAYLEHSVGSNAGEEERMSVSFNLMFSSFTEKLARPAW